MQAADINRHPADETPRWAKVFGALLLGLALLVLLALVAGHSSHSHHMPAGLGGGHSAAGKLLIFAVLMLGGMALNWSWLAARVPGLASRGAWPRWVLGPLAIMPTRISKFMLTTHITSSVGFLGAVACFFTLAVAGLTSRQPQIVQASYIAMEVMTLAVIVPLSVAALLSGLVQAFGTPWGLLRHYWVVIKLLLSLIVLIVLLQQLEPISYAARTVGLSGADLFGLQASLAGHAGAGLVVLVIATILSVYKPRGITALRGAPSH